MVSRLVAGPPVVTALLAAKPADGIPVGQLREGEGQLYFDTGAAGMFIRGGRRLLCPGG